MPRVLLHVGLAVAVLTTGLLPVVAQQVEAKSRGDIADLEEPCDGNDCDPTPQAPEPRVRDCGGLGGDLGEPCGGDAGCDNDGCDVPCVTESCPTTPRPTPCSAMRCYAWEPCESDGCDCDGDLCEVPCDEPGECKCGDGCVPTPCEVAPCKPCKHLPCRVPDVQELTKAVRFDMSYPERKFAGESLTVNAHVVNKLRVPLLLTVEMTPKTDDVCSAMSYSTSGSAAGQRKHEFLLLPKGSEEKTVPGVYRPDQGLADDTVSATARLSAETPGTCKVQFRAVVQTIGGVPDVWVGEATATTTVKSPPPSIADLGTMNVPDAGFCGTKQIHDIFPKGHSVQVAAGKVKVSAVLEWTEACADVTDWAVLGVQRLDRSRDEWVKVAGAEIEDNGKDVATREMKLGEGNHTFRVRAVYYGAWFDWNCLSVLLEGGAAGATLAWAILHPEPVGKIVLAAAALGALSAVVATNECETSPVLDKAEYTVTVQAVDADARLASTGPTGGPPDGVPTARGGQPGHI